MARTTDVKSTAAPSDTEFPKDGTALVGTAGAPLPATAGDEYDLEDLGAGTDDLGAADVSIPFLGILQKMSPQVDSDNPAHMKDAKVGMIINSVTNELYSPAAGIFFLPVHHKHSWIEWIPRDQGGGYVTEYTPDDPMVLKLKAEQEFGKLKTDDGNDLIETFTVFGVLLKGENDFEPAVISMSSSNIKAYKAWMTKARSQTVVVNGRRAPRPLFAHVYHLSTEFRSNQSGTWYSWTVKFFGGSADAARIPKEHPLFQAAKGLRNLITSGSAHAAVETAESGTAGATSEAADEM